MAAVSVSGQRVRSQSLDFALRPPLNARLQDLHTLPQRGKLFGRDGIMLRIPRIDVSALEQFKQAPVVLRLTRPDSDQIRVDLLCEGAQEFDAVGRSRVVRLYKEETSVETLYCLVQHERRVIVTSCFKTKFEELEGASHAFHALLKMLFSRRQGFFRRLRLRRHEGRAALEIVERDALFDDVGEEVLALAEGIVHLFHRVHDEIDRGPDTCLPHDAVFGAVPVGGEVNHALLVDDDKQVIVAEVALCGVGLVYPSAASIGSEQDDLEDPALLLLRGRSARHGVGELLEQDFRHAGEFALLAMREVVEVRSHHGHIRQRRTVCKAPILPSVEPHKTEKGQPRGARLAGCHSPGFQRRA